MSTAPEPSYKGGGASAQASHFMLKCLKLQTNRRGFLNGLWLWGRWGQFMALWLVAHPAFRDLDFLWMELRADCMYEDSARARQVNTGVTQVALLHRHAVTYYRCNSVSVAGGSSRCFKQLRWALLASTLLKHQSWCLLYAHLCVSHMIKSSYLL